MAPPKKPAARRQRRNTSDVGSVVAIAPQQAGRLAAAADPGWSAEVAESWSEFWSSPLAGVLKETDLPALRRLFRYRDLLGQARDRFLAEPESVGSMGQLVLSPWAQEMHRLEAEVQKLEDRFGLTPLSRLRLGVTFHEESSLASRNAQLLEEFRSQQAAAAADVRPARGGVDRGKPRPRRG